MANTLEEEFSASSATGFLLAFCGGALIGAAAGILLAPKTGRESREQLKGYIQKTRENLRTAMQHPAETVEKVVATAKEAGRRFVDEK